MPEPAKEEVEAPAPEPAAKAEPEPAAEEVREDAAAEPEASEAQEAPEAEAVARIAQIGFPYQYPITREKSPLQKVGWFANFFLRTFVLSKLLPSLFSPAAIVLVQRPQLSYAQVWRTAKQTTRRLQGLAVVAAVGAAWPWLRRLAVVV